MGESELLDFWTGLWPNPYLSIMGKRLIGLWPNPYLSIMGKRLIPIRILVGWDRDKSLILIGL